MTTFAPSQAERAAAIGGPLRGHHRLWHVVTPDDAVGGGGGRLKVEEPLEGALWFDRRSFASEGEVLSRLLDFGMQCIPPVRRAGSPDPVIIGFVEGDPLNELVPAGKPVGQGIVDQIMAVFRALAGVSPETVEGWGVETTRAQSVAGSAEFLGSLIDFTREEVYEELRPEFADLFDRLGVSADGLAAGSRLADEAARLTDRPFRLLHGDLHRANFIVDPSYKLWTIDWELATLGDPLYEFATHLYLMRYPADQEWQVTQEWRAVMSDALPGAVAGFDDDLPRYLAYKRAQSVYTDVVRHAIKIRDCGDPEARAKQLRTSAPTVAGTLARARDCLGMRSVPSAETIERIYDGFCRAG